jgi:hypothetical protein
MKCPDLRNRNAAPGDEKSPPSPELQTDRFPQKFVTINNTNPPDTAIKAATDVIHVVIKDIFIYIVL